MIHVKTVKRKKLSFKNRHCFRLKNIHEPDRVNDFKFKIFQHYDIIKTYKRKLSILRQFGRSTNMKYFEIFYYEIDNPD